MEVVQVHPVLRVFDVRATLAFYIDYLGFTLDWQEGDGSGPTYLQVSRGSLHLHLSTHHGDGTPGTVLVVEVTGVEDYVAGLHRTGYPFFLPGVDDGPGEHMRSTELIDPAGNMTRLFERGG